MKGRLLTFAANAILIAVASIADVRRTVRMAVHVAMRQSGPSPLLTLALAQRTAALAHDVDLAFHSECPGPTNWPNCGQDNGPGWAIELTGLIACASPLRSEIPSKRGKRRTVMTAAQADVS